jgi:hypothetical protein
MGFLLEHRRGDAVQMEDTGKGQATRACADHGDA